MREKFDPLYAAHLMNIQTLKDRASSIRASSPMYVADLGIDNVNKFIPYYLFRHAEYTVAVSAGTKRAGR